MSDWLDLTQRSVRRDGWVIRRGHPDAFWRVALPASRELRQRLLHSRENRHFERRADAKDFVDRFAPLLPEEATP